MPLLDATPSARATSRQPKVVVVDDEPAIVEVVCDVLEDEGIPAAPCPEAVRAHACIRAKQPAVVILDVQMPGIDGIDLFRQLRADPATSTISVIFFTANAHKLQQRLPDYAAQGAVLIPKPFNVTKLIDAVTQVLGS